MPFLAMRCMFGGVAMNVGTISAAIGLGFLALGVYIGVKCGWIR